MGIVQVLASKRIGGGARIAVAVADRLRQNDHQVHVLVPGIGPAYDVVRRRGIHVTCYRSDLLSARGVIPAVVGNIQFGFAVKAWRRALVHFHAPHIYGAARHCSWGNSDIVHVHSQEHRDMLRWALQRPPRLIVTCARFLDAYVRDSLPLANRDAQTIVCLPNAVDVDQLAVHHGLDRSAAKRAVGASADCPLILVAANLMPSKGQHVAIRATARLKALGIDVTCWLAGEDREQAGYDRELSQLAYRLGVSDRVKLLGFRSDMDCLYAAADALLLPSTLEGLPLTILEAQAAGVPVLASPVGGIPEVIDDGQTGWLIAADDVEGYAQRIKSLIESPGLRQSVAYRAFEYVRKHHNWDDYCNKMVALYDSLLA